MISEASPELLSVTDCGGYGPAGFSAPNVSDDGANLAAGAAAVAPIGIPANTTSAPARPALTSFMRRHLSRASTEIGGTRLLANLTAAQEITQLPSADALSSACACVGSIDFDRSSGLALAAVAALTLAGI